MKTKILLVGALLAGTAVLGAVHAKGHFGGRGPMGGKALEELNLSDEQQEQLKALRQEHRQQMQAFKESGERPSPEQMQELRQAHRAAFEAILTTEQAAALQQFIEERGDRGRKGRKGHRGPRFGALPGLRQLDLSDEQKEQLKSLMQQHRDEMKTARQSGQRPTAEERQAHRESLREAVKGLLTAEQLEQLEAFEADRAVPDTAGKKAAVETKSWGSVKQEVQNSTE